MKKITIIASLIITSLCSSQDKTQYFEIGKVYYKSLGLNKLKGDIIISDSIISFTYNNPKTPNQSFRVVRVDSTITNKTYYVKLEGLGDFDGRFSLSKSDVYKKTPYTLLLQSKDSFTGIVTEVIYFLRKKD